MEHKPNTTTHEPHDLYGARVGLRGRGRVGLGLVLFGFVWFRLLSFGFVFISLWFWGAIHSHHRFHGWFPSRSISITGESSHGAVDLDGNCGAAVAWPDRRERALVGGGGLHRKPACRTFGDGGHSFLLQGRHGMVGIQLQQLREKVGVVAVEVEVAENPF